jgi:hypothetical protein
MNSAIAGGDGNTICGCATCNNGIVGGSSNQIYGSRSAIGAGANNYSCLNTYDTAIPGGYYNIASGSAAVAMGYYRTAAADETAVNDLQKYSDNFNINHPDPAKNKTHWLTHSTIEAPTAGDNLYRFQIETNNCQAVLELPSYYKFLNCNDYISVTATNHYGKAYGTMNQEQSHINITSNQDGKYDVIVIGTRKDKLAQQFWRGTEIYGSGIELTGPRNIN